MSGFALTGSHTTTKCAGCHLDLRFDAPHVAQGACASCHVQAAGRRYAGTPLSPAIGQAVRWPFIRGAVPVTLQAQIRECLERMGAAPFAAGSEELNDLEYFLTYLSNGLPVKANAWRSVPR